MRYEKKDRRLPELEPYLARLGMEKPRAGNLEDLNRLILNHQLRIPFELTDHLEGGYHLSLETEDMFDKIILQRRGGCCFELNALFYRLVEACGYRAWPARARTLRGKESFFPPSSHRVTLVELEDGLYYCEVGYGGPQPGCAVKLEDGFAVTCVDQSFRMERVNAYWWILLHGLKDGSWEEVMEISTVPEEDVDFEPLSYFCLTHPDSFFAAMKVVNRRTETGNVTIENDTFIRIENGVRTETVIRDQAQYAQLLREVFGIPTDHMGIQ